MREVKPFRFQFGVGALLGLPEIQVFIRCGEPLKREDGIDILRGGEGGGAALITESQCGSAEEGHLAGAVR